MFNSNTPSLSDIAAVTNGNDGFAGGNGWWVLIILLALFGGWGNGGYGGYRNAGADANYVLASDFATLQRQIDTATTDLKGATTSITNGISSLGYDQLNQINGINNNIANLGYQLQQCCCDNKQAIALLQMQLIRQLSRSCRMIMLTTVSYMMKTLRLLWQLRTLRLLI